MVSAIAAGIDQDAGAVVAGGRHADRRPAARAYSIARSQLTRLAIETEAHVDHGRTLGAPRSGSPGSRRRCCRSRRRRRRAAAGSRARSHQVGEPGDHGAVPERRPRALRPSVSPTPAATSAVVESSIDHVPRPRRRPASTAPVRLVEDRHGRLIELRHGRLARGGAQRGASRHAPAMKSQPRGASTFSRTGCSVIDRRSRSRRSRCLRRAPLLRASGRPHQPRARADRRSRSTCSRARAIGRSRTRSTSLVRGRRAPPSPTAPVRPARATLGQPAPRHRLRPS